MFGEYTEEYFLKQAKSLGDELGVDTRTGSVYMDLSAGHAIRTAFFFACLDEIFNMFALDTCYADVLDDKAEEWGLSRHDASAAVYDAVFTGTAPEEGARFFAEDSGYYFTVAKEEGVGTLRLMAETEGAEANTLSAGTPVVPVDDIEGLAYAALGEIYAPGLDEESDDALRARLREKMAGPAENGNRQHYKTWCESVDGVGRARILPLFAGPCTVRAVLYDTEGKPCTEAVVNAVQEYVDPITQNYEFTDDDEVTWVCGDGFGDGVANLGAHFKATAAIELEVRVSLSVTPASGYTAEDCATAAATAIDAYLQDLTLNTEDGAPIVLRYSNVGALISDLEEVLDYEDLLINNGTSNISVADGYAPVLKEVSANA